MYHEHWGLERLPFARGQVGDDWLDGESQAEALARLRFVVAEGLSALLVGAAGVGKTQVLNRFAFDCRRRGQLAATISLVGLTPRELLWQIAAGLRLAPRADEDAIRLFRRLGDFAAASHDGHRGAAVLLDNVDEAGPDVRTHLARLVALESWSAGRLSTVFAVTRGGSQRLGSQLLEAADLRIDLEPWSEEETIGYVQHSLLEAGADRPLFDEDALRALHSLAEGVPRRVNRLADRALSAGAAEHLDTVPAGIVEAANRMLGPIAAEGRV